jgi:hypothetical protein
VEIWRCIKEIWFGIPLSSQSKISIISGAPEHLKLLQSSELLHTKLILLVVRITVSIKYLLFIGWRTFIWWKNPPKDYSILVWLRDVGILYSRAEIQRTIVVTPAFLEHSLAEKIAVCAHTNRDPNK